MKCLVSLAVLVAVAVAQTPGQTACSVTCDSSSSGACAFSNGTSIPAGTTIKVLAGTNITCSSGSFGQTYVYQICSNAQAIDQVCISAASASISSFTTQAAAVNYCQANGIPYSNPGAYCNTACSGNVSTACTTTSSSTSSVTTPQCSQCFSCTTAPSREEEVREERQVSGSVVVACSTTGTVAQQTQCFINAACAGSIKPSNPGVTCNLYNGGVFTVINCPACPSTSKKGLLGLLGLLGLIPLLLCISLLCLLLLCCIRRKKTAAAVPFATFDPGLPPVAATCPPLAPTCPVIY